MSGTRQGLRIIGQTADGARNNPCLMDLKSLIRKTNKSQVITRIRNDYYEREVMSLLLNI